MTRKNELLLQAAEAIGAAEALMIGAGAGFGVDSGLPDFRGDRGFWKAYPAYRSKRLSFVDLANPRWFREDPRQAWGFYGHRLNLYRKTIPHEGFHILQRWAKKMKHGSFVFTSNVDGQFERAGYDPQRVLAVHGAIERFQCMHPCNHSIWSAGETAIEVDEKTFRPTSDLPLCPNCGSVARPNILMFGDASWLDKETEKEHVRFMNWLESVRNSKLVVIEFGAGLAVPTVRHGCEKVSKQLDTPFIRVNPREAQGPSGTIEIACGALRSLEAIDEELRGAN